MKKHFNFFILCLFTLSVSSCKESFLNLAPEGNLTDATFFKTEDDFRQALNGAYANLRDVLGGNIYNNDINQGGHAWNMSEMRSDNTHYDFNAANRGQAARELIADFANDFTNPYPAAMYSNAYRGIGRANTILSRIGGAALADDKKNQIIGEAKFLRALHYFQLVRYFGGVPLFKTELTSEAEAYAARASVDETYSLILDDAKDAVAKLAVSTTSQTGQATKGSAKALLADVLLTRKNYADAEKELKDVVAMGYALLPDYASVFAKANKNSRESVFEVQYQMGSNGQESNWLYCFVPRTTNTNTITGITYNNTLFGGWNTPVDELITAYEAGDKRLNASIGIAEGTVDGTGYLVPASIVIKNPQGYTRPTGNLVGKPFVRKYLNTHSLPLNTDDNWPVYRYAEVLLQLAEALNEQNKTAEAVPFVNQVRARAGLAATTATTQTALREAIWRERRVELAFENKRWFDLIRMPEADAIRLLTAHGTALKSRFTYLTPATYQIKKELFIYPIPQREISLNPTGMTQNPGY